MSIIKKSILLLKSQKSNGNSDKYENLLKSNGFEVIQIKTLNFVYKNLNKLKEKLEKSEDYSGIILSSPRCVNAVYQALYEQKLNEIWRGKNNFSVGETTCKDAFDKLGIECKGKESGNANNLAKIIMADQSNSFKPFLFPHGNLKTDTLNNELAKENLFMDNILVYETIANPNIEQEFAVATQQFTEIPEFVVFFSPSGLYSTINYIRKVSVDLNMVKFVAIGPVTQLAMEEENLNVVGVAKNPTAQDILDIILNKID